MGDVEDLCPPSLMLDHVFAAYDLRKIYLEVPGYNLPQMTGIIDRYFTVEGRRQEHIYYRGRYHDEVIVSISQAHFMTLRSGRLAPLLRDTSAHAGPCPPTSPCPKLVQQPQGVEADRHRRVVTSRKNSSVNLTSDGMRAGGIVNLSVDSLSRGIFGDGCEHEH